MTPGTSGRDPDDDAPTREIDADAEEMSYVGETLAGRYRIEARLGEGAMGAVFVAQHVRMERRDAIKILDPELATDDDARARFTREAQNASRINHPNVCTVYDFGETVEGLPYLAMEYVDGEPLTRLLEREGPLPPRRAVDLAAEVTEALDAAHSRGIVHRDLKPDNIMLDRSEHGAETVKVVDFGIAKAARADDSRQEVTREGLFLGTPEYVSPEQVEGERVDPRSDLYSLGIVLYEMLTGRLPFSGPTWRKAMMARLSEKPVPLRDAAPERDLSPELERVLHRTLRRAPEERYESAEELRRELRGATEVEDDDGAEVPGTREIARPEQDAGARPWTSPSRWPESWRRVLYGAAVVAGLSGFGALGVTVLGDGDPAAESTGADQAGATPAAGRAGGGAAGGSGESGSTGGGSDGGEAGPVAGGSPPAESAAASESDTASGGGTGPPASVNVNRPGRALSFPRLTAARADSLLFRQLDLITSGGATAAGLRAAGDSARGVWATKSQADSTRGFAAYVHAQTLLEQADSAGAVRWLERALELDPDGPGYRLLLESIRDSRR